MTKEINKSNEIIPKVFELRYEEGRMLYSFKIKIENGKIVFAYDSFIFRKYDNYIIPSEEEWMKFWDKMDNIRVWNWMDNYDCPDVLVDDGSSWNLKIELGDKKVESSGSDYYPGENVEEIVSDQSESFKKFLDALRSLTGFEFKT